MSAASAPASLAWRVSSIASAVELEPAPAITGTLPLATSRQSSTTRLCSLWLSVGDSPVVPHGTRPCVPCSICQAMKFWKPRSSTAPLRNGVIVATNEPWNMDLLREASVLRRPYKPALSPATTRHGALPPEGSGLPWNLSAYAPRVFLALPTIFSPPRGRSGRQRRGSGTLHAA